ncbi:DUF3054 domain-containing protein [Halorubrum laminariae]|uniref:DUF3054 domain-containing protein n=1 Tax=Halorubrum laminariae TaxID=1433523 RepID=A0ABD6C587_9EURY|nr:DUF3054 domain-containing protein [Halorubrum laminariae]
MDDQSFLARRLDRAAAPLAVGDVLVLMAMLTAGTLSHRPTEFLANEPTYLLGVWAPFLIGWFLVAPLVGAYAAGAVETAKSSVPLVVRSWIPAAAVGFVLRAVVFRGGVAPTFVAVILAIGAIALGGWRALYFRVR